MVTQCRTVQADAGSIYPAGIDRAQPGETIRVYHDLAKDVDCQGVGVTITQVAWSIAPDDGLSTLSSPTIDGLEVSTLQSFDVDETQRVYVVTAEITTSDARKLLRAYSVPVIPTRAVAA